MLKIIYHGVICLLLSTSFAMAKNSVFEKKSIASYYADKFHGRTTASGAIYDKNKLTAAHTTLPVRYGIKLLVTNLTNKKSVIVIINDRKPVLKKAPSRTIDLSYAAAKKIDLLKVGLAKVHLEVIKPNAPAPLTVPIFSQKKKIVQPPSKSNKAKPPLPVLSKTKKTISTPVKNKQQMPPPPILGNIKTPSIFPDAKSNQIFPPLNSPLASYYPDSVHGYLTANGERYDRNKLTASHTYLAYGTQVKVTNIENNTSITVRINDRKPPHPTHIMDLSYAAAARIGLIKKGAMPVKLETVTLNLPSPAPATRVNPRKIQKITASFYPDSLNGRLTASGHFYDRRLYTASHKNLPFGTRVKVTNPQTKRTMLVVINDRMPANSPKDMDLSYAAANHIGILQLGAAMIYIEIIGSQPLNNVRSALCC
ncbi:MAG: septal ring lytic transglycosylase RlpA family protein [Methylococcaceae bacterium]|nr:septal ring lytic transglycosylase RlpA family protein [Methylococcaceae bacterium]